MINRQLLLARRPTGMVDDSVVELVERELPNPADGQVVVRVEALSIDPTIRTWMDDVVGYLPPIAIGEVIRSAGVGVIESGEAGGLTPGTRVFGLLGWQQYALVEAGSLTPIPQGVEPTTALNLLGITSLTAYFGLREIGKLKQGDAVLVSGAAGATGSVAGQLARVYGASKVVGIAGSEDKCAWITDDLGFDAAINYKTDDIGAALKREFPNGIDVYFDNVGGEILDLVLARIADHARIVLCGAISSYTDRSQARPLRNHLNLIPRRGTMQGFIILDYAKRYSEGQAELSALAARGELKTREYLVDGLEQAPHALNMLFTGANTGKTIVRVS
jgi:NADPH-dependent curcumin reductase CurA